MNFEETLRDALLPSEDALPEELGLRIHRAVRRGVRRRRARRLARAGCCILACVVALAGAGAVSPQVAKAFARVPVLSAVIELVRNDPGLALAIHHEYIQRIGQTAEIGDSRVTLQYIMADDHGLVLFLTAERPLETWLVDSIEADGVPASGYACYGIEKGSSEMIEIAFHDARAVPGHVSLSLSSWRGDVSGGTVRFEFAIDRSLLCPPKRYALEVPAQLASGVRIQAAQLEVYPTVALMKIEAADLGEAFLSRVEGVKITADDGTVFEEAGMSAGPNRVTVALQSPYFAKSDAYRIDLGTAVVERYQKGEAVVDLIAQTVTGLPGPASIAEIARTDGGFIVGLRVESDTARFLSTGDAGARMTGFRSEPADPESGGYLMTLEFEGSMPDRMILEYPIEQTVPLGAGRVSVP